MNTTQLIHDQLIETISGLSSEERTIHYANGVQSDKTSIIYVPLQKIHDRVQSRLKGLKMHVDNLQSLLREMLLDMNDGITIDGTQVRIIVSIPKPRQARSINK